MIYPEKIKKDFPLLQKNVRGKSPVYLDNAATSQKPQQVLDAITQYYSNSNANVHRGVHILSDMSTQMFEQSRETIASFFGARNEELILVRNTTEALNGVAYGWCDHNLSGGDVVLTSVLEHHSSIVVWQQACARAGAQLVVVPTSADGQLEYQKLEQALQTYGSSIKLLGLVHVSNTTGAVLDLNVVRTLLEKYKLSKSVRIALDGAQSAPHMPIDFKTLNVDFFACSGHKMLAPMGVGALLVRKDLLESGQMQPWLFGGGMIESVSNTQAQFSSDVVDRFTAGTPDVASAVGFARACEYLSDLGMQAVYEHDLAIVAYAYKKLSEIKQVRLIGPAPAESGGNRVGSVSFVYDKVHAHDVAQVLSSEVVAVRSGHHCTMPFHTSQKLQATVRASFSVYTSTEDIDALIFGLKKVATVFGG